MPETVQLSARLGELFSKTKLVCFGRYALEVPQEAQLIWGGASFPSKVEFFSGGLNAVKLRVEDDVAKLKRENRTAEITYSQPGPIANSWQIRYYESRNAKIEGLHFFNTYVNKGELTFLLSGSVEDGETEDVAASREALRANGLRLRALDEIPAEPGYCIEHGFFTSNQYADQEIVNVGLFLPSFPDVSFSLSSNKNAYGDYSPEEFEKNERSELSLLARIQQAKDEQGAHYPKRTVLREGKRDVQHWHGEESMIKRTDGTHDFEWALVGKPRDVANPAEFGAQLYTKVEHNIVGAAKAASLSDDEAVALWDKLLSGLKFRVKVPGAPPGSYYFPKASQPDGGGR
ncbi:T6SS immunity protein Tli4 family protein [Massilia agilis]|uniref:T6SS immunity protein Tli4 family protein n=1 Tax=Massilia agilis TaxID=1811226 RepID=A0ABT2DB60_9BURK|nr:T6SS immunity protein Tli4 family protein [Massilia agilis]